MASVDRLWLNERMMGETKRRWGVGLACLALIACHEKTSTPVEGSALRAIDLRGVSLLPAIAVSPAPTANAQAFAREEGPRAAQGGSLSVGTSSRGYLVGGTPLPRDHATLKVRPVSIERRAIHGTHALVRALQHGADTVARRWNGSLLYAGDISAREGGDIRHHASHNSGRDADLVFFMRDLAGAMADGPDMEVFGADGRSRSGKLFDDARNWEIVAALLQYPGVQVQWIFVATHLEERLMAYAHRTGADAKLMDRGRIVMRQPGDSSPHADHFHVRFYCALEERLRGCVDTGERHSWVNSYSAEIEEETRRIVALLRTGGSEEKRYVIKRIGQLATASGAVHLEPLMEDPDPTIRTMAIDTVAFLRGERTPPAWAHLTDEDVGE